MTNLRVVAAFLVSAVPLVAVGQTCEPPTSSNEAKIFGNRSLALAHGRAGALIGDAPGTIRGGVEFSLLPNVSDETATPTTCRPGKEPENVNVLPGIVRARIAIVLPARLTLEASWLPPVELKGMKGNVFGVSLDRAQRLSQAFTAGVRVHAAFGSVTGPITCDEDALADAASECFGGTLSSDKYKPNILGADITASWQRGASAFTWYGGAGYTQLKPRFQVHFVNSASETDSTRVEVDLSRVALFGGATRRLGSSWRASAEVYATTEDGATVRLLLDRVLRRGR